MGDVGSSAAEVRLAVGLLAALAGRTHAVRTLMATHSQRLKRAQTSSLKPQNAGVLPCQFRNQSKISGRMTNLSYLQWWLCV